MEKCLIQKRYGLTDEELKCFKDSPELIKKIGELVESGITDPCHISMKSNEIVNELINRICSKTGDLYTLLNEELLKGDYIIEDPSFTKNKRLKCLWDKLKVSQSSTYCNNIDDFEGKTKLNIRLVSYSAITSENAQTMPVNQGYIDIWFKDYNLKNYCDIFIMKTMLHEGYHATIDNLYLAANKYGKNIDEYFPDYQTYLSRYHNSERADHEYIAKFGINKFVQGLKDIYGDKYSDDEYIAIVWQGLQDTDAWRNLTDTEKNDINTNLNNVNSKCEKTCN